MKSVVLEKHEESTAAKQRISMESKKFRIIAVISALFLIASICVIFQSINTSSINISAHFSAVTDGKNPDGSPFDINELLSDEVLEAACEKLGGKVDAETIEKTFECI